MGERSLVHDILLINGQRAFCPAFFDMSCYNISWQYATFLLRNAGTRGGISCRIQNKKCYGDVGPKWGLYSQRGDIVIPAIWRSDVVLFLQFGTHYSIFFCDSVVCLKLHNSTRFSVLQAAASRQSIADASQLGLPRGVTQSCQCSTHVLLTSYVIFYKVS